jgi:hypothetical protein
MTDETVELFELHFAVHLDDWISVGPISSQGRWYWNQSVNALIELALLVEGEE